MTSQRAQAYGRVLKILEDLGPTKLLPEEQQRIREAIDTLLFVEDVDVVATLALDDVEALAANLRESGRWTDERVGQLVDDIAGCGPIPVLA